MQSIPIITSRILLALSALTLTFTVSADDCRPSLQGRDATLESPAHKPVITGHPGADQRIRLIAESRGYRLQAILADESDLAFPWSVHRCLLPSWRGLRKAALEEGHALSIVSGYRSVAKQRQIFLSKLAAERVDLDTIARGEADRKIHAILEYSAIPGYSRHHSGFTLDIQTDGTGLNAFGQTAAYRWISADNFRIARQFGFVPSYPEELPGQGPVPEPWEFIWVGDAVTLAQTAESEVEDNVLLSSARNILIALDDPEPLRTVSSAGERSSATSPVDNLPGG